MVSLDSFIVDELVLLNYYARSTALGVGQPQGWSGAVGMKYLTMTFSSE